MFPLSIVRTKSLWTAKTVVSVEWYERNAIVGEAIACAAQSGLVI